MTQQALSNDWRVAFETFRSNYDLNDDGLGLFAISLRFGLDDPRTSAAESITGGSDDKKCDVVYLDRDRGVAVVAQCYWSSKERVSASSNKASDLNTAVSWLFKGETEQLPLNLKARAQELRLAIENGEVNELHLWYVHNLPESQNVLQELRIAEATALAHIPKAVNVKIFGTEVGYSELERLYRSSERTISVTEKFHLIVPDAIEVDRDNWSSLMTVVPGLWLYELFQHHKESLFSANVRDYLGSRASDANINNGIKSTAENDPDDFFIYNNGVTALVLDYLLSERSEAGRNLTITGVSIVNGAQTTGSLGNLLRSPSKDLMVAIRFVKCDDAAVVENLVRFNNSQNRIQASDFRSSDGIQERLRWEFSSIDGANYEGGRRGGASDAMKRNRATLPSYTVGQVLTAFHGDPVTAYDKKSDIWVDDRLYSHVFNERTSADHILFCYSLLEAVTSRHISLNKKVKMGQDLRQAEQKELAFWERKGANYLTVYAVSMAIEIILGKTVTNHFDVRFSPRKSVSEGAAAWNKVLSVILPFTMQLDPAFARERIAREEIGRAVEQFVAMIESRSASEPGLFAEFAVHVRAS